MYIRQITGHFYAYFRDRYRKPVEKSYPPGASSKTAAAKKATELLRQYEKGEFDPWNPGLIAGDLSITEVIDLFLRPRPEHLRFRSQRHTTASWLLQRGTPLTMVKSHMGHASVQTTMIYNHDDQQLTSAAFHRAFG